MHLVICATTKSLPVPHRLPKHWSLPANVSSSKNRTGKKPIVAIPSISAISAGSTGRLEGDKAIVKTADSGGGGDGGTGEGAVDKFTQRKYVQKESKKSGNHPRKRGEAPRAEADGENEPAEETPTKQTKKNPRKSPTKEKKDEKNTAPVDLKAATKSFRDGKLMADEFLPLLQVRRLRRYPS